jgi:hypothetical protein
MNPFALSFSKGLRGTCSSLRQGQGERFGARLEVAATSREIKSVDLTLFQLNVDML